MRHDWIMDLIRSSESSIDHYGDAVIGVSEPVHVWYIQV